ncbi:hypothetical protein R1sor_017631 [Riccia sorocarpa]|uniref:Uncharacterized protein n=1 Tax=Riccia sorocarpa TaxID=122646 RepID=A0ABD3I988_9MARC
MTSLSKVFQKSVVDISAVRSIVKTTCTEIELNFLMDSTDLNAQRIDDSGYHLLPEFGPPGGYLRRLQSELRRGKFFHSVELDRCADGRDLEEAFAFQKAFATALIGSLHNRFQDVTVVSCFKNRAIKSGGMVPVVIDANGVRGEFRTWKIQCMSEWSDKDFHQVAEIVSNSPTYSSQKFHVIAKYHFLHALNPMQLR